MNASGSGNQPLVRVESIIKEFNGKRVLDKLSFELRRGEILGFLGPNGAGKTTAMRILTGFFPPNRGRIWIREKELFKFPKKLKARIGYLPEVVHLYSDMRVEEFIDFAAAVKGLRGRKKRTDVEQKLYSCGLWQMRRRLIGKLSKGYRQRVGLAQALVADPEILVLDEPTTGLDPRQIIEIRELIRELGKDRTVILSTHILPEVNMVCDRVLIINQGRVVASGTTEELASGLKDRHEILVTTGSPEKKDEIVRLVQGLPEVQRVQVLKESPEQLFLALSAARGRDLRPEISRLFVSGNIPLLEIRSGELSLEEIFMKLVVDEGNLGKKA